MTTKADFNGQEWQQVAEAPALAGLIVATAQRGGTLRESLAMGKAYAEAKQKHGEGSELLGDIVAGPPQVEPRQFTSAEDLRTQGIERLRSAVALVESKATPDEAESYKRFAITVAQRAAEADKSGGVLGIGGERVSDAERTALAEIAEALGTEAPSEPTG
jgi:hypothetical protein